MSMRCWRARRAHPCNGRTRHDSRLWRRIAHACGLARRGTVRLSGLLYRASGTGGLAGALTDGSPVTLPTKTLATPSATLAWGNDQPVCWQPAGCARRRCAASQRVSGASGHCLKTHCSRSLATLAARIRPTAVGDLTGARAAVAHVVGRETAELPPEGVTRAALESLAESTSDGVVAPLFWGVVFGLPGLAAYKAINTLDSMIGHRDARYAAFGGFAARLDDVANYLPARLTGLLVAAASLRPGAFTVMWRDARRHRSPNAGWPESAAAGALGVRLSAGGSYEGANRQNPGSRAPRRPGPNDLRCAWRLLQALSLAAMCWSVFAASR